MKTKGHIELQLFLSISLSLFDRFASNATKQAHCTQNNQAWLTQRTPNSGCNGERGCSYDMRVQIAATIQKRMKTTISKCRTLAYSVRGQEMFSKRDLHMNNIIMLTNVALNTALENNRCCVKTKKTKTIITTIVIMMLIGKLQLTPIISANNGGQWLLHYYSVCTHHRKPAA